MCQFDGLKNKQVVLSHSVTNLLILGLTPRQLMSLPASVVLLITFASSLDPDQARRIIGPDLYPNCLRLMVFLIFFSEKVMKKSANYKKCKITAFCKE